jgi:tetratricopeptide (TPR) repeat protein
MDPPWDALICHRGPDAKQTFASFLHYALDVQGIRAFFDHKMVGGTNPSAAMKSAMHAASWGVVILSPRFFESKWCMEELGVFLNRGNLLPVALELEVDDIDAAKIVGKEGDVWGVHGGELWKKCEMEEAAWRSLVGRVPKEVVVVKSEDSNDYWGELINELVINLARKLGRPVIESRVVQRDVKPPFPPNQNFLGRDGELATLHTSLLKPQSRVSISGVGGMGKTQLALEYVFRHAEGYWKLLWVSAGASSLVIGLAENLGVTLEKQKGTKSVRGGQQGGGDVALIKRALELLRVPCLLVFDDLADSDMGLLHSILPTMGSCKVLVTTRLKHLPNFHNLPLGQLSKREALTLIRGSPRPGNNEADLEALANRFGNLTLALSVCSAWMKETEKSPSELGRRLDKKGEVVKAFEGWELDPVFKTNPDLLVLFQASVEQLKSKPLGRVGEHVLWVGGWFASVPIRYELLSSAASMSDGPGVTEDDIEDAVDLLVKFSLAARGNEESRRAAQSGVVFHAVVQSFGRVTGGDKRAVPMVRALVNVGEVELDTDHFQHAYDLPIPPKKDPRILLDASDTEAAITGILLPLVSYYHQKGLYSEALKAISSATIDEMPNELQGLYLNHWALSLQSCGQYTEAQQLSERALRIDEKVTGPEYPAVSTSLYHLAVVLDCRGKYEEALPLFKRALRIEEKALGPEHSSVATTLGNMANLLRNQGKYEEALPLYERSLRIHEKALGPEHSSVATTLGNMANLLRNQGKYEEALPLYERSLRINEKALGLEHRELAVSLANVGGLLECQGKFKEALPQYERALRILEKALGPEHPDVATMLNNMAGLRYNEGKDDKALQLFDRALRVKEKALGSDHPSMATTLNNMAKLLEEQGKHDKALPLYERSLCIKEKALGLEHLSVAITLKNMAGLLRSQGKFEEVLTLYERCLRVEEKQLGAEHPSVATTLNNMALLLESQGKYEEALPLFERDLRISKKALGPEHPDVANICKNVARIRSYQRARFFGAVCGRFLLSLLTLLVVYAGYLIQSAKR